jgi:hypothetical protein
MRNFTQKPKATQQTASVKPQAVQRMLQTHAEEPESGSTDTASPHFGHDFSRIPIHPPAAGVIQTKLAINQPGDEYEQEADHVSEQVVRMHARRPEQPIATTKRVQAKSASPASHPQTGQAPLIAPTGGQPLAETPRAFMESRFGADFGQVRIHTDERAAASANALGAYAYTQGNHVAFADGRYDTASTAGQKLLAHELTHVMQQERGADMIQRKVTPKYEIIKDRLTYGLFDWAITDQNALDVLNVLAPLSDRDLADTVAAMDRDELLDRLMENISEEDQSVFAVLIGRINRHRSVSHTSEWIVEQLSRGFWDWAVTDDDAKRAFMVLRGLNSQELRSVVAKMVNAGVYDRLREELPKSEVARFAAFMDRLDRIRDEFNTMVGDQVAFFRNQKDAEGKPVDAGEVISKRVKDTGYGGSTSTWNDLSDEDKESWRKRAAKAIEAVKASVVGTDLEPILSRAHLVFIPEKAEKLNAYAYVSGVNKLYFGRGWVRDAEKDPANVWQSIAHELGGHEEFGSTWSWEIMKAALKRLTPEEYAEATSGSNSVFSAYGYLETELYAELRELPYRTAGSGGDKPESDVPAQLKKIKEAFSEKVALQIVIRLYYRVALDPRVSDDAKKLLYHAVQEVFSLFPLAEVPLP